MVGHPVRGSEESIQTLVTVDAGGVTLTVLADSAALVVAVDVHAESLGVHRLIVGALGGVAVTVTRLTLKLVISSVST